MNGDLLEILQADITAILRATPALADANILADNQGNLEAAVLEALKTASAENFKMGLALTVMLPELTKAEKNLPGPIVQVTCEVQVIEQVVLNRGTNGTHKRSSQAALAVLKALHLQSVGGHLLYAENDPVKPVPVKLGFVSHVVTVCAYGVGNFGPGKPAGVQPSMTGDGMQLTCDTPATQIFYTTDGRYPAPGTMLYSAPVPYLPVGTVIRAAAYAEHMNPGDVTEFKISA